MAEADRSDERHSHNPLVRYFKLLGPGLVSGASDDAALAFAVTALV